MSASLVANYEYQEQLIPYAVQIDDYLYELTEAEYHALQSADGTHPIQLECLRPSKSFKHLKTIGAIQTHRLMRDGLLCSLTLLVVGGRAKAWRKFTGIINRLLPYACLLAFVVGLLAVSFIPVQSSDKTGLLGFLSDRRYLLAFLHTMLAVISHEFGHLAAAVTYGYPVRDIGLFLIGFIPIGAYTSVEVPEATLLRQEMQLHLAGCEVNLLLIGLWLTISRLIPGYDMIGHMGIWINGFIFIFNLLPAYGLDGAHALGNLLGVSNVTAYAYTQLFIPEERTVKHRLALFGCLLILLSNVVAFGANLYGIISLFHH